MEQQNFQSKVFLTDSQTPTIHQDTQLNTMNEINQDVLQQALQQSLLTDMDQDLTNNFLDNQYNNEDLNQNILAIFENDNGDTQTVQLSLEQAEALGLQLSVETISKENRDNDKNFEINYSLLTSNTTDETNISQLVSLDNVTSELNFHENNITNNEKSTISPIIAQEQNGAFEIMPQFIDHSSLILPTQSLEESLIVEELRNVPLINLQNTTNQNVKTIQNEAIIENRQNRNKGFINIGIKEAKTNNLTVLDPNSLDFNKLLKVNNSVNNKTITLNESPQNICKSIKSENSPSIPEAEEDNICEIQSIDLSKLSKDNNDYFTVEQTEYSNEENITNGPNENGFSKDNESSDKNNGNNNDNQIAILKEKRCETNHLSQKLLKKITTPNLNRTKPLGSSENPFQLVQQGPTFHSVQLLSQEQLRHITTVLQNRQSDNPKKGKSVFYDAATNTRIIYRIVYPEDLNLQDPHKGQESPLNEDEKSMKNRRGRPPNAARKPGPENNQETPTTTSTPNEKEEALKTQKKKKLARTRSGRLSRPPRHMIKDYKQINPSDTTNADQDSDGNYSDYRNEQEDMSEKEKEKEILYGPLEPPKKRQISSQFRCPTCSKLYLGFNKMAKHFEVHPDHGNIDQIKSSISAASNQNEKLKKLLENSPNARRGKRRRPWNTGFRSDRRIKIKELMQHCTKEELGEWIGPSISNLFSLYELALLRFQTIRNQNKSIINILTEEVSQLVNTLRKVASQILFPFTEEENTPETSMINLKDNNLCSLLGFNQGKYKIDESSLELENLISEDSAIIFCKRMKKDNQEKIMEPLNKEVILNSKEEPLDSSKILNVLNDMPFECLNKNNEKLIDNQIIINPKVSLEDRVLLTPQTNDLCSATSQELVTVDDIINERLDKLRGLSEKDLSQTNGVIDANLVDFPSESNFSIELQCSASQPQIEEFSTLVEIENNRLNNGTFNSGNNFDALNEIVNDPKPNITENFNSHVLAHTNNTNNYNREERLESINVKQHVYPVQNVQGAFESDIEMIDSSNVVLNSNNDDSECRQEFQIAALTALDGSELDFEAFTQFETNQSPPR